MTIESPTKGTMRVRVEQRDNGTVAFTLLDGISAGYGFTMRRNSYHKRILTIRERFMRLFHSQLEPALPPISRMEIYDAAKNFIEQLGSSGYLDDEP